MQKMTWKENWPMTNASFNLTQDCNLGCSYCFVSNKAPNRMSFETAKACVNFLIKQCQEANIDDLNGKKREIQISFWGGEPLLEWELLKKIVLYTEKVLPRGMTAQFGGTTNGTLLTPDKFDFLDKHKIYFMVSFDGTAETHNRYRVFCKNNKGSHAVIEKNLIAALKKWPFYRTRVSLYPERIDHFYEDVVYAFELGVKHLMFSPVYEHKWTEEKWNIFVEQSKKIIDYMAEKRKQGIELTIEHFKSYTGSDGSLWPCLTGGTKISLLNGTEIPIQELAGKENFYVYSCKPDGQIVPGKVEKVWKTGNRPIVKITLDNGKSFKCTPDHKLMLRDGTYKEAKDCLNESMMPLYRRISPTFIRGDYEQVLNNKTGKYEYTYQLVDVYKNGKIPPKNCVHHIDFNYKNNEPYNLQRMNVKEHYDYHQSLCGNGFVGKWRSGDKDFIEKHSKRSSKMMKKMNEEMWSDPIHRERMLQQCKENGKNSITMLTSYAKSEKGREQSRQSAKKMNDNIWSNPDFIKLHSERNSKLAKERKIGFGNHWKNNEFREKMKEICAENGRKNGKRNMEAICSDPEKYKNYLYNILKGHGNTEANIEIKIQKKMAKKFPHNHKIISIEYIGFEDVYDMEIKDYHNFAISPGIFVHNCGAGRFYFGIDWDGSIFPCHRFNKFNDQRPWQEKETCMGHVGVGITKPEWRKKFENFVPIGCEKCEFYKSSPCNGGCYGVNFDFNGDICLPCKELCNYVKKQKEVSEYYKEKMGAQKMEQQGKSCVCYNMCYLEGTEEEIVNFDGTGNQCHCYNTSYSGDLNTEKVARPLTAKPINPYQMMKRLEKMEETMVKVTDVLDKLAEKLK